MKIFSFLYATLGIIALIAALILPQSQHQFGISLLCIIMAVLFYHHRRIEPKNS